HWRGPPLVPTQPRRKSVSTRSVGHPHAWRAIDARRTARCLQWGPLWTQLFEHQEQASTHVVQDEIPDGLLCVNQFPVLRVRSGSDSNRREPDVDGSELTLKMSYIGRKRWPNARLTFNGRCKPRTTRL